MEGEAEEKDWTRGPGNDSPSLCLKHNSNSCAANADSGRKKIWKTFYAISNDYPARRGRWAEKKQNVR